MNSKEAYIVSKLARSTAEFDSHNTRFIRRLMRTPMSRPLSAIDKIHVQVLGRKYRVKTADL